MPRGFVCVVTVLLVVVLSVVAGGGRRRGGILRHTWKAFFLPLCVFEPGLAQGEE